MGRKKKENNEIINDSNQNELVPENTSVNDIIEDSTGVYTVQENIEETNVDIVEDSMKSIEESMAEANNNINNVLGEANRNVDEALRKANEAVLNAISAVEPSAKDDFINTIKNAKKFTIYVNNTLIIDSQTVTAVVIRYADKYFEYNDVKYPYSGVVINVIE